MATYKVPQDIEAEDKLLGPLTLRQFIYAGITIGLGFIMFKLVTVKWWTALPFLPPAIFFGVLAAPFGHDQPSEVWLLAKVRFFLKPRRRVWDQAGFKELVTITVPKKIERQLTKGLSQTEVRSRLQALAHTIDSRGWAVKNVNVNLYAQPSYVLGQVDSDRLLDPSLLPQDVPAVDVQGADDMLDERNNATALHLEQLLTASTQAHKQQAVDNMYSPQAKAGHWFLGDPSGATLPPTVDEQALSNQLHQQQSQPDPTRDHMRTIQPLSSKKSKVKGQKTRKPPAQDPPLNSVTPTPDPATINLANNNDLTVATIARQVNKQKQGPPDDEVVISLR